MLNAYVTLSSRHHGEQWTKHKRHLSITHMLRHLLARVIATTLALLNKW